MSINDDEILTHPSISARKRAMVFGPAIASWIGGVDIEAHRARRDLVVEVDAMRLTLAHAHRLDLTNLTCLAEALRPVVDRMRAALPEMEKSK